MARSPGEGERSAEGPRRFSVVVGSIALLGIATDDGVVIATYLEQIFRRREARGVAEVREWVVEAGLRRARPCLMTTTARRRASRKVT